MLPNILIPFFFKKAKFTSNNPENIFHLFHLGAKTCHIISVIRSQFSSLRRIYLDSIPMVGKDILYVNFSIEILNVYLCLNDCKTLLWLFLWAFQDAFHLSIKSLLRNYSLWTQKLESKLKALKGQFLVIYSQVAWQITNSLCGDIDWSIKPI